jgi:hypothetical protein
MPNPNTTYRLVVTSLNGKALTTIVDLTFPDGLNPVAHFVEDEDGNTLPLLVSVPLDRKLLGPPLGRQADYSYLGSIILPKSDC